MMEVNGCKCLVLNTLTSSLQAVVLGAVKGRVLNVVARAVANSVGHPVVEANRKGLGEQRMLRQHVSTNTVACIQK